MRKLVALALFAMLALIGVASGSAPAQASSSATAVYRFWSDTKQGHFYTSSVSERDQVIKSYPTSVWKYEGAVYTAFASKEPGTVPLYRFWSDLYQEHFYTISEPEKADVIARYPDHIWKYEGVAYYVYPIGGSGTLPVARFWSDASKHHFYTSSAAEAAHVKRAYPDYVWKYEHDAFAVSSTPPVAAPATVSPPGGGSDTSELALVLSLVNARRAASGLPPLSISTALTNAAGVQALYQASINDMTHDNAVSGSLGTRVTAAGFKWCTVAENVAMGYTNGTAVHNGWVNSPGHLANILNPSVTHMGLAKATASNGTPYWAEVFARAC